MKFSKEELKKSLLLYAVTDRHWLQEGETLYSQVEQALRGGATFVQLREKHLEKEAFLAEAREMKELCRKYNVPFVINDECTIRMKVTSRNHNFLLTIDGRSQSVSDQEWLIIRKAPFRIHIVRKYGKDYFETLRNKLMWGADKR